MSDIITKRSEEFKELTDWMVQTTREIETAMKHLRPTIGQEHYLTGDEICRRFHVCKRTLQTLRDTKAIPYTTLGGKILYPVIVKTCSDIFYTIGQKKCPMPSAKIRNYSHSHNLVSQ